jgi:hypothetical protein
MGWNKRVYHPKRPHKVRRFTRHHDRAKVRGGTFSPFNIFILTSEHHRAYHKLFGVRSFDEAARVLLRMQDLHREHLQQPLQ